MNEKTEELRDIFLEVADGETVTESQEAGHGSLTGDDRPVEARLGSVVAELREKFAFTTDLADGAYCTIVRGFYEGIDDDAIAADVRAGPAEVFRARMDLHLVRDDDPPGGAIGESDLETVCDCLAADESPVAIAETLGVDRASAERAVAVVEARNRSRRVSHRFRTSFEETLTDADLTVQLTGDAHEDGLEEATEGAEVDVEF
jgi:hypothetical protein